MTKTFLTTAAAVCLFAFSAEAQYYGSQPYGYPGNTGGYYGRSYQNGGYGGNSEYNRGTYSRPASQGTRYNRGSYGVRTAQTRQKQQKQNALSFYVTPRVGFGGTFGWISELDTPYVPVFGVAGGLKFNNFRAELEFNYRLEGELFNKTVSSGSASAKYEMNYSQYDLALNGYYDFNLESKWTPFIGAGLGVAKWKITDKASVSTPWGSGSDEEEFSDAGFIVSVMGGVSYQMTDHIALEGMARYRYLSVDADAGSGLSNVDAIIGARFSF